MNDNYQEARVQALQTAIARVLLEERKKSMKRLLKGTGFIDPFSQKIITQHQHVVSIDDPDQHQMAIYEHVARAVRWAKQQFDPDMWSNDFYQFYFVNEVDAMLFTLAQRGV